VATAAGDLPPEGGVQPPRADNLIIAVFDWFKVQGPPAIVLALMAGVLLGVVATTVAVFQFHQPASLVEWLASEVATDSFVDTIEDVTTGMPVTQQNRSYTVPSGHHLRIHLQPSSSAYTWSIDPRNFGYLQKMNPMHSEVDYVAPDVPEGKTDMPGTLKTCRGPNRCESIAVITVPHSQPAAQAIAR
jgi:hypothetical protein